jgi:hypothetical protein
MQPSASTRPDILAISTSDGNVFGLMTICFTQFYCSISTTERKLFTFAFPKRRVLVDTVGDGFPVVLTSES